jgi:tetratricopeptide (TPR) repeat protein
LAVSPLTTLQAADPGRAEQYDHCMELAATNPQNALEIAQNWQDKGGGRAAGHCTAVALFGLGRFGEAALRFESLAEDASAPADARVSLWAQAAQAWLFGEKAERSVVLLTKALEMAPEDDTLLVDKALAEADLGRYQDAVNDLSAAIKLRPGMADAYVFRASAYRQLNFLDQAEADADKALSLDQFHPEGLLERGNIRRLKKDKLGARRDWMTLLTVAPKSEAARAAKTNLDRMDAAIDFKEE